MLKIIKVNLFLLNNNNNNNDLFIKIKTIKSKVNKKKTKDVDYKRFLKGFFDIEQKPLVINNSRFNRLSILKLQKEMI